MNTIARRRILTVALFLSAVAATAQTAPERTTYAAANLPKDYISRPLRYHPDGTDFVITNGAEFFNRSLYGSSSFRVDGGDKPEFSLYLPGRGGNVRFGIKTAGGVKWLNDAREIVARYRPGSMVHEIRDPLLGDGVLHLTTLALSQMQGIIFRAELSGASAPAELVWAMGGVNGMRGSRDGDIGTEREPVSRFFQLSASQCAGNVITISNNTFRIQGKPGVIEGIPGPKATMLVGSAANWDRPEELLRAPNPQAPEPVVAGSVTLQNGEPFYLALDRASAGADASEPLAVYREVAEEKVEKNASSGSQEKISAENLGRIFDFEEQHRRDLAERVTVETPDPYINAAAAALNVAANAVWDVRQSAYLHGGVAWRVRLLGWRVGYCGDELGWHERTAAHFAGYARQQNTNAIPEQIPPADESANLARNETALHSNGDLTKSHYDMNLLGVDIFFRHLLWTGDLQYARQMWPVIVRHLAWERRLFRREFGPEKLPLYEAYCCIWASDDLAYDGGGGAHSTALNYYHNRMAARVARLLGEDPSPYEHEADLIEKAMQQELWLGDRGWFAEYKDLLGLQSVHPNAALWTFYHTVDSEVPSPMAAWQMTRAVDTQIPRIPLRGPGVPEGSSTVPTTTWMPYSWSINNVVMAETMHTSLAYWQAGRPDGAFPLFKGAILDSMYLGLCPGNVGMCTYFDAYRHESQRDFGDGIGATSRALVEGLFGVHPDELAGELKLHPGFPLDWDHASIRHPDFDFDFRREGLTEKYEYFSRFPKPMALHLQIPALRDDVAGVTVNGAAAKWSLMEDSVGRPEIEITAPAAASEKVTVAWKGGVIDRQVKLASGASIARGGALRAQFGAEQLVSVQDPQGALNGLTMGANGFAGNAAGAVGQRTVFANIRQGAMSWWQPVDFEIQDEPATNSPVAWHEPMPAAPRLETLDLTARFNAKVTQIFKTEYLAPRSPYCSLATPTQGIGTWCHPTDKFEVDDSGLRREAEKTGGKILLPNGVPLATPGAGDAKNVAFVSQWSNYPAEISLPLAGKASRLFLLMAGSTSAMQSRFDNGEVIANYTDGSSARLALQNPTTWWPIDQDYYIDDYAFARPEALPPRVDLRTGKIRVLEMESFKRHGRTVPGGAATVLDLPLDPAKELKSLTVRALANEVVIGLMSATLER